MPQSASAESANFTRVRNKIVWGTRLQEKVVSIRRNFVKLHFCSPHYCKRGLVLEQYSAEKKFTKVFIYHWSSILWLWIQRDPQSLDQFSWELIWEIMLALLLQRSAEPRSLFCSKVAQKNLVRSCSCRREPAKTCTFVWPSTVHFFVWKLIGFSFECCSGSNMACKHPRVRQLTFSGFNDSKKWAMGNPPVKLFPLVNRDLEIPSECSLLMLPGPHTQSNIAALYNISLESSQTSRCRLRLNPMLFCIPLRENNIQS